MLHIMNLEEVQSMLLRVPELIDNLEKSDPSFFGSVKVVSDTPKIPVSIA